MSLLSLISLTVILARIEKHFVDAELGTYNLEECIKELLRLVGWPIFDISDISTTCFLTQTFRKH